MEDRHLRPVGRGSRRGDLRAPRCRGGRVTHEERIDPAHVRRWWGPAGWPCTAGRATSRGEARACATFWLRKAGAKYAPGGHIDARCITARAAGDEQVARGLDIRARTTT